MKKNIAIAIGILGVAIIGGGAYLYATRKPNEEENPVVNTPSNTGNSKPKYAVGNNLMPLGASANIRASASATSAIKKNVTSGNLIGTIISYSKGSDGFYWYKVADGYVREDVVKLYVATPRKFTVGETLSPLQANTPIYSAASTNSSVLATLTTNQVTYADTIGDFVVVKFNTPIVFSNLTATNISYGYVKSNLVF